MVGAYIQQCVLLTNAQNPIVGDSLNRDGFGSNHATH